MLSFSALNELDYEQGLIDSRGNCSMREENIARKKDGFEGVLRVGLKESRFSLWQDDSAAYLSDTGILLMIWNRMAICKQGS